MIAYIIEEVPNTYSMESRRHDLSRAVARESKVLNFPKKCGRVATFTKKSRNFVACYNSVAHNHL